MIPIDALLTQAELLGISIEEQNIPIYGCCGLYSDKHQLIIIDNHLNDRQKLCTLQHELIHAEHHDIGCENWTTSKLEHRTRQETARRLINPMEYALAETIYDSANSGTIALELGVTIQVLEDYQKLLAKKCFNFPMQNCADKDMRESA